MWLQGTRTVLEVQGSRIRYLLVVLLLQVNQTELVVLLIFVLSAVGGSFASATLFYFAAFVAALLNDEFVVIAGQLIVALHCEAASGLRRSQTALTCIFVHLATASCNSAFAQLHKLCWVRLVARGSFLSCIGVR